MKFSKVAIMINLSRGPEMRVGAVGIGLVSDFCGEFTTKNIFVVFNRSRALPPPGDAPREQGGAE
jgi:hypothetical protein